MSSSDGPLAYKRVLPPELSKLPGELITRDITDKERIHPNDPPHIRRHLIRRAALKANPPKLGPGAWAEVSVRAQLLALRKHPDRYGVINQPLVDIYRAVILVEKAKRILQAKPGSVQLLNPEKLSHIWFDTPADGSMLKTHAGAEPPNSERPAFLKNLKLTCDIMDWPQAVLDMLVNCGPELEHAVKAKCLALRSTSIAAVKPS